MGVTLGVTLGPEVSLKTTSNNVKCNGRINMRVTSNNDLRIERLHGALTFHVMYHSGQSLNELPT